MGRRSVWSDAEVRELTENFVLAADEVWRLQGGVDFRKYRQAGGDDPECLLFQDMASGGHFGGGGGTKQGIYVCTPSGKLLASNNSLSAGAVKNMLKRGLEEWNKLPEDARTARPTGAAPAHRWEWNYPEDGLVLKSTSRYLSDDPVATQKPDARFNFDFAWFSADEAAKFISDKPATGQQYELPQVLFERFVRFHLLNTAHGESGTYRADEVRGELLAEVVAVDEPLVQIRISGNTHAAASQKNVGHSRAPRIVTELLGHATFNGATMRFEQFEMVAKGQIFGSVEPIPEEQPSRLTGWYFTLGDPDNPFERLYPTQVYAYDVDWLVKPTLALHGLHRNVLTAQQEEKKIK